MAAQVKSFHLDSHSKNASLQTSKMQNLSTERGQELLIRNRTDKGDIMEIKPRTDSKKTSIPDHYMQNQAGEELSKAVGKGTEKLNIKESKDKSSTHSKKMCFCSPTTHEGSFRCHLHRISAAKKSSSATERKSSTRFNSKRTHDMHMAEFKPQLSRFGRVASPEVGPHDSLIKLSGVDSA